MSDSGKEFNPPIPLEDSRSQQRDSETRNQDRAAFIVGKLLLMIGQDLPSYSENNPFKMVINKTGEHLGIGLKVQLEPVKPAAPDPESKQRLIVEAWDLPTSEIGAKAVSLADDDYPAYTLRFEKDASGDWKLAGSSLFDDHDIDYLFEALSTGPEASERQIDTKENKLLSE